MSLTATQCQNLSSFLFRRTPNFLEELEKDYYPRDFPMISLYETGQWPSFHGTEMTWDRVHVMMPQDAGDWEQMHADDCTMAMCNPEPRQIDWGSSRYVFGKFRRRWQTRVLCLDQLRHIEMAKEQVSMIYEGLSNVPEFVIADWLKLQQILGATNLYIAGSGLLSTPVTSAMFPANGGLQQLQLPSTTLLPTSKVTMPYLQQFFYPLMQQGYFKGDFMPTGKMEVQVDIDTQTELTNQNPSLSSMYDAADFEKGGKFFKYGVMGGCGNMLFKPFIYPPRFYHSGNGLLTRVWPFQNTPATVGGQATPDPQYIAAPYQISGIVHPKARKVLHGEVPSMGGNVKFGTRGLWGQWQWWNGDYIAGYDPNTGTVCQYDNRARNYGQFWADFEAGVQNTHPEFEAMFLHLRQPPAVADVPISNNATPQNTTLTAQSLLPYNPFCNPNPTLETPNQGGNPED